MARKKKSKPTPATRTVDPERRRGCSHFAKAIGQQRPAAASGNRSSGIIVKAQHSRRGRHPGIGVYSSAHTCAHCSMKQKRMGPADSWPGSSLGAQQREPVPHSSSATHGLVQCLTPSTSAPSGASSSVQMNPPMQRGSPCAPPVPAEQRRPIRLLPVGHSMAPQLPSW